MPLKESLGKRRARLVEEEGLLGKREVLLQPAVHLLSPHQLRYECFLASCDRPLMTSANSFTTSCPF